MKTSRPLTLVLCAAFGAGRKDVARGDYARGVDMAGNSAHEDPR